MKTRQAKRVGRSLANGNFKPLHVVRAAALQLGHPLQLSAYDANLIFHPVELKGKFYKYYSKDYSETYIVPESRRREYERQARGGSELGSKPGTILFDPHAGSNIVYASRQAAKYAYELKARVVVSFNGIEMVVRPFSGSNYAADEYHRISDERHQAYLNSEEYKQAERERLAEVAFLQESVNHAMLLLPATIEAGLSEVVEWVGNIQEASDHVDVNVPAQAIISQLEAAGYKINDYVGDPLVNENAEAMGRWIVGQAMSCLASVGAIHQVIHKFTGEYRQKAA